MHNIKAVYISDNNNFATLQYSFVIVFNLWYLAPRSLALEVFKLPILLLLQLPSPFPIYPMNNRNESAWDASDVGF